MLGTGHPFGFCKGNNLSKMANWRVWTESSHVRVINWGVWSGVRPPGIDFEPHMQVGGRQVDGQEYCELTVVKARASRSKVAADFMSQHLLDCVQHSAYVYTALSNSKHCLVQL